MADQRQKEWEEPKRASRDEESVRGISEEDRDEEFDDTDDLDEEDAEEDEGNSRI